MDQRVLPSSPDFDLTCGDSRLWCLGPGVHREVIEAPFDFLDIHIGGAVGGFALQGDQGSVSPCPPDSFTFLAAGSQRCVTAIRTGATLRAAFPRARLAAAARPRALPEEPLPLRHAFDAALVGTACVIRDRLALGGEAVAPRERRSFLELLAVRLAFLLTQGADPAPPKRARPVQRAIEHIEANLAEPLRHAEIAALAGVSPYHFARLFREAMGMSLHQYIVGRRVARAQELIQRTSDGLADIAYHAGFGSQSHMTTVFRRHLGRTPGEVRARRSR